MALCVIPSLVTAALILSFSTAGGQDCPAQGISTHVVLTKGNYRLTTLQRGNYTIQGLTSFTKWDNCREVSELGLISSYAMQHAIDEVNKDSSLIPGKSFTCIFDHCSIIVYSFYRFGLPCHLLRLIQLLARLFFSFCY